MSGGPRQWAQAQTHQLTEDFPGQAGAAFAEGTLAKSILKELPEMFGQRAGSVHEMKDQGREHLGQRDARTTSAPPGQGGQNRTEALPENSGKTGRRRHWGIVTRDRSLFFMPLFATTAWTNADQGLNSRKALDISRQKPTNVH